MNRISRTLLALALASVLLASCTSDGGSDEGSAPADDAATTADASADDPSVEPSDATRDDVDCSQEGLGADDATDFVTAHLVVDGELGAVCLGEEDPTLLRAWDDLATITPTDQLNDLAVFAGFVNPQAAELGEDAETTLAFVNALDDEGTAFQMSVDLDEFDADPDQARLTIAHEFSHVFTTNSTQLDRSQEAFDDCTTYLAADGCFYPDALITAWVETFWGDGLLDTLDPDVEPSLESGAERCELDAGFLGPYAASDPEEDFAESFSAFVFAVPVPSAAQERLDWMADQPGLVEFRERAEAAGLTPLPDTFDPCG